jgi:quercetin dioxygenase-like cupin family protein
MFVQKAASRAQFSPDRMGKADLLRGDYLFAGLNCFEPGQEHAPHTHSGQDKLYIVLEGSGEVTVGNETRHLEAGDCALAKSEVVHSIRNTGPSRMVVMAVLAPPPALKPRS